MRQLFLCLMLFSLSVSTVFAVTAQDVKQLVEARDKKALANAEALAKTEPKNAEAWILLTRARLQSGKTESAIKAGETAAALAPKNAQTHYWLGNAYGARIGQVGMMSKMSLAPKLRDAFEATVKLDPNNIEARSALVEYYLQAPGFMGGSKDKAMLQANEIAKRDEPRGHVVRAQIYMFEKNYPAALKSFEAAHAAKPENENIRMGLGVAYQEAQRWNDAYRHFRAWVAQDAKAAGAWYQIGRTSAVSGLQLEEGITALQKYLVLPRAQNDPPNKNAYHRLGQLYAKLGKKAEAKTAFMAALKLDPKFADAKTELGKL